MLSRDMARLRGGLGGLYGFVTPDPSMSWAEKGREKLVGKRGRREDGISIQARSWVNTVWRWTVWSLLTGWGCSRRMGANLV